MDEHEKMECAKSHRDITFSGQQSAERRGSELADEFNRLEVQIATILFAFAGFFFSFFTEKAKSFSFVVLFLLKFIFASSLFFLILSLTMGLLNIKRKEKFWDEVSNQRLVRYKKWMDAVKKQATFEEAEAFHSGTSLGKGIMISSPIWTWVLQTIFLALAIILLFALLLIFLF